VWWVGGVVREINRNLCKPVFKQGRGGERRIEFKKDWLGFLWPLLLWKSEYLLLLN